MADISHYASQSGLNIYFQVRSATTNAVRKSDTTFEAFDVTHWSSYANVMTDVGGGWYEANMPASVPAGTYILSAFRRAGLSPASSDQSTGTTPTPMVWSGTAELPFGTVVTLPNPAPLTYGPVGTGSRVVNHDYPAANNLRFQTSGGIGIGGALVRAYLASEYAANPNTATVRGQTLTLDSGAWANPIDLDPGSYQVTYKAEGYELLVVSLTVS